MMRSLWTAASGMTSQQLNVDTISHNLANVNTTGFKKERMEFKSLLYQTMKRADQDPANTMSRPVNLQVGHGVRPSATARIYEQGNITATGGTLDFALEGEGFFSVRMSEDKTVYTKDGAFKVSIQDNGDQMIVSSEGYPVLSMNDEPIYIPADVKMSSLMLDRYGYLMYVDNENQTHELGLQIDVVQFANVQGLEALGNNFYATTPASGPPIKESTGDVVTLSGVVQGYLERSNVNVADEMVDLIVAQRAYELNSKCIQAADEMLQNANNLKR